MNQLIEIKDELNETYESVNKSNNESDSNKSVDEDQCFFSHLKKIQNLNSKPDMNKVRDIIHYIHDPMKNDLKVRLKEILKNKPNQT